MLESPINGVGKLQTQQYELTVDLCQFQFDQFTFGSCERIERIARDKLNMAPRRPPRTQYLMEGST
jgi:cell division protein FtsL